MPVCKHVASIADYRALDPSDGMVAFSCIGRLMPKPKDAFSDKGGPCNYAGGGLFRLNPIKVISEGKERDTFDFADEPLAPDDNRDREQK